MAEDIWSIITRKSQPFFFLFFPDLEVLYKEVFTGLVYSSLSLPDSLTGSCNFFSAFPAAS